MQERQVTIEGVTRPLARPFLVLATQNPIEYEGTYPLPEAQLDRFLLRIGVGYPSREDEWSMLAARIERREDEVQLEPLVDAPTTASRAADDPGRGPEARRLRRAREPRPARRARPRAPAARRARRSLCPRRRSRSDPRGRPGARGPRAREPRPGARGRRGRA